MKKAIADKWVKALRSGDYKQSTGRLRSSDDKFCCLGVLCNIHAQTYPKHAAAQEDSSLYDGCSAYPPESVLNWAGLKNNEGNFGEINSLAEMNDQGASFREISDIIENNWRKL
jgi:hypothetical protein